MPIGSQMLPSSPVLVTSIETHDLYGFNKPDTLFHVYKAQELRTGEIIRLAKVEGMIYARPAWLDPDVPCCSIDSFLASGQETSSS